MHSDQALAMLADVSRRRRELLGAIPYQENEAVLHTDRSLLPRRKRAWASWNFHLQDEPAGMTTVTYHMNRLQSLGADRQYCVTLNRSDAIAPGAGDPRAIRLPPSRVHAAAASPRSARWARGQRGSPDPLLRRVLGLRLPRGRRDLGFARLRGLRAGAAMTASALYEGWVRHRRHTPVEHEFRQRLFMSYLDFDELPELLDRVPLWSARRPAPAWFRRGDYLEVEHDGPVRLLTHVRTFGHLFNPVSLYYCFDRSGEQVERVLAEVTNTPWGESHTYVLDGLDSTVDKALHVSPLLGMDSEYRIRMTTPGQQLRVHMESHRDGAVDFDATLALTRREFSASQLVRYPIMTARVLAGHLRARSAVEAEGRAVPPPPGDAMIWRALMSALLGRLTHGRIEIVGSGQRRCFGPADAGFQVTIVVHDRSFWRALARGSRGIAESYAAGSWDCDDLVTLVRIAAREAPRLDRLRAPLAPLRNALTRVPRNTRAAARRHIASHYDLGNDLFALFLDETMTYSCGYGTRPRQRCATRKRQSSTSPAESSSSGPDDHLLEIGTGWGSMALHAAERYGCRVTTATLSREQYAVTRERVRDAGLGTA